MERVAVAGAGKIFIDDRIVTERRARGLDPRRDGERIGVQIRRGRHGDILVHAIERQRRAGHRIEDQRRGRGDPDGIIGESAAETIPRGVGGGGEAATFIEMPEPHQAVLAAIELPVLEIIEFVRAQRAVPIGDFINITGETRVDGMRIPADEQRFRGGSHARRADPGARTDGRPVQKQLPTRRVHRQSRMMPKTVGHRRRRRGVNRVIREGAIIESPQLAALHHQDPAIAGAIQVFARDTLNDGGTVGSPKPRGHRKGIAVEVGGVGHSHQGIAAAETECRSCCLRQQVGGAEGAREQHQAQGEKREKPNPVSIRIRLITSTTTANLPSQLHGTSQATPHHPLSAIRSKQIRYF